MPAIEDVQALLEHINRTSYFSKGKQMFELNGKEYSVDGVLKFLKLMNMV